MDETKMDVDVNKHIMTKAEAITAINQLRKVFTVVRLIDVRNCQAVELEGQAKAEPDHNHCYDFWNKNKRCENCVCSKVLADKQQKSKFETLDGQLYQVVAKYLVIDGLTYVLELINKIDENVIVDPKASGELENYYIRYNELLYLDPLTQVYNRRYYDERLKASTKPAGVAMVDIDNFKLYNDVYGHDVGDAALRTVARITKECLKRDDIVIRYGGDEFIIVMPGVKPAEFSNTLKQICAKVQEAIISGYSQLNLTLSIGGVMLKNETVKEAVTRADKLMYQAKTRKNMVITETTAANNGMINNNERQNVLIVDDSPMNRFFLKEILKDEFDILEAADGEEALDILHAHESEISCMLLDIVMPNMNGFDVLQEMNLDRLIEKIPVIVISGDESVNSIRKAYDLRATDFINRPFDAGIVHRRVLNAVLLYAKQKTLMSLLKEQYAEKEKANHMMINILSHIVEFRNKESGSHVLNINRLTRMLLERMVHKTDKYKLSYADISMITNASTLHDIGKISIPDTILNKPGKLTKEEFEIMKTHTTVGAQMLKDLDMYKDEPFMQYAYQIARWHHERYDGKGYPDGLVGEEIPISAQIVSLCDVYDALTSERVYKPAFSQDKALDMIMHGECGQFNPLLLQCLMDIKDDIKDKNNLLLDD